MSDYRIEKLSKLNDVLQQQLLELFVEADFSEDTVSAEWLDAAVQGSLAAAGAFDPAGNLVGFGRLLGDGASDCYLQDLAVSSRCRQQGIGSELVKFLIDEAHKLNIDWIGLIATPGKAEFYRRLGFEEMSGFTPMMLKKYE